MRPMASLSDKTLFEYFYLTKDTAARETLILRHRFIAISVARRFIGFREPLEDLIQVGSIGLIKAVERFNPFRGNKFSSYAIPTILGEIKRHFRDNCWRLKVDRKMQEVCLKVIKVIDNFSQNGHLFPNVEEIAAELGVPEEDVICGLELYHSHNPRMLDEVYYLESDRAPVSMYDFIGECDPNLENLINYADLYWAISKLSDEEKIVIMSRSKQQSQREIAQRIGCSQMRICRLEAGALKKLKEYLQ